MQPSALQLGMGFGLPREAPEWLAVALAVATAVALPRLAHERRRSVWLAATAAAAAALSIGYLFVYLRGGPRIIDATSYWLEARAMASGWFGGWPLPEPHAATMGRFLLRTQVADGPGVSVIFPPGYPAVLALGFLARAPMLVGPLLAAALCIPTWYLGAHAARELLASGALSESAARVVAPAAALLGAVCGALRYHTADTMSHGLAALCVATAIACALRASTDANVGWAAAAGLATGWLVATRPASGVALAALGLLALSTSRAPRSSRAKLAGAALAGCVPGAVLLLVHQRALGDGFGVSSQAAYYAVADGPPGCFRYGFGEGIGCFGEHGDFVRARLASGFGALAAAGTTLRRLRQHLVDPMNFEVLALLVPVGALLGFRARSVRLLAGGVLFQVAAYVPFYFDGNYPGGGGRFYADVLPLEHVLAAAGGAALATRLRGGAGVALLVVPAALLGFAFRAGREHAHLRDREGGRPMFEPAVVTGVADRTLVFMDTDHGYNLAARPGNVLSVARWRGDALDWMAWDSAGRPRAVRYRFDWSGGRATTEPVTFAPTLSAASPFEGAPRIEGESLWPAIDQSSAWALPEHAEGTCASKNKWLRIRTPRPAGPGTVDLDLPTPWLRGRTIIVVLGFHGAPEVDGVVLADGKAIGASRLRLGGEGETEPACRPLEPFDIPQQTKVALLRLHLGSQDPSALVALDHIQIQGPAPGSGMESR